MFFTSSKRQNIGIDLDSTAIQNNCVGLEQGGRNNKNPRQLKIEWIGSKGQVPNNNFKTHSEMSACQIA
jgi:hypothetical protein